MTKTQTPAARPLARKTVLIMGASGKIGRAAAYAFKDAEWDVRRYDRKTGNVDVDAAGVDVIIQGMNPAGYHDWDNQVPAITALTIRAARVNEALVIIPGNVYNFAHTIHHITAASPQNPPTRKGAIRVAMERAYAASGVQTVILRAGSFVADHETDDLIGALYLRNRKSGKINHAGDRATRHALTYLPDWARAAVGLAEARDQLARFEDIPLGGLAPSFDELLAAINAVSAKPYHAAPFPWWMVRMLAPFNELMREVLEMRPSWDWSHDLDATRIAEVLPGFAVTPLATVMAARLAGHVHKNQTVGAALVGDQIA